MIKTIVEGANVPVRWLPWLATCEIAGAIGILIGIAWAPLGIIAALGLVLYFVGAIIAHLRAGDVQGMLTPIVPLLFSVAVLITRILAS